MSLIKRLALPLAAVAVLAGCASQPLPPYNPPPLPPTPTFERNAPAANAAKQVPPVASLTPEPPARPRGDPLAGVEAPLKPINSTELSRDSQVTPVEPPPDLWARIRRGYAMPDLKSDLVSDRERWYATRPDYIARMTERSRKYLFHVVEELERRNMPTELALLPFIESAFNPQAVSSAKAAGMWQFIPSTGKHYDLKQNVFRDDRRDVLASTNAALNYLQKLHDMFGDWHLALAAYNWGEGSVQRAIAKNQRAGLGVAYTDLTMPSETQYYVPKLQAVKNIVAAPQNYDVELPAIENHPYFQRVEINRDIDVSMAAQLANVSLADFKALNPSAHKPVIFAAGMPQILLPWDNAEVFRRNLEAHNKGQTATWTAWTAPKTMKVADAAKAVGMSEGDLRSVNTIPPRYLIKSGSTLLVVRGQHVANKDVSEQVADNAQIALAPEIVLQRKVVKAGKKDSIASLAQRYKVSTASIAEWNHISAGSKLKAGQQVVLMLPQRAAGTRAVHPSASQGGRAVAAHGGVTRAAASKAAGSRSAAPAKSGSGARAGTTAGKSTARATAKPAPARRAAAAAPRRNAGK